MGSVTEADIAHFREHGHVTIRRLLPRTDTERLVERLDGMLDGRYASDGFVCGPASRETPDDPGRFILQVMAARFPINDPVLAALSGNRRLRAAAAALMGSEHATVFQQQALIKGVDAANGTPWHQDDHYWQLARGGYTAVTAWMPLRRTTAHGGTMWLLPGSHRHRIHDHDWAHGVSMFKTITGGVPEHDLIPLELEPGDVSFHHKNLVHGAFANRGVERRIAIAQHYHNAPDKNAAFAHRRHDPVPWKYQVKKPVGEARRHSVR